MRKMQTDMPIPVLSRSTNRLATRPVLLRSTNDDYDPNFPHPLDVPLDVPLDMEVCFTVQATRCVEKVEPTIEPLDEEVVF